LGIDDVFLSRLSLQSPLPWQNSSMQFYRRNLPHMQRDYTPHFITFCPSFAASCQIGLAISCWDVASTITAGDIAWN
jgi:hypothetical protein